ncbi:hypothetical protein SDRG_11323 [Saprolegnia diclina VS20]|uniref:Uncharacterized protein n=1 Tax=Saprolegnia diclina (strain VS20) TaxID=1156394 RepID=T0PZX9_SAPDV|nr:hypothetical protein SDRG_11323 [Saprolegnia diclina VS20]EQC31139.1 hypothetical protein SDRG_11323 [Saprolegnia diclina VS20]|eukprot:XP_008615578.1 hypothetical protein SDRG_11323 [Saprolegnia diclina VS20]
MAKQKAPKSRAAAKDAAKKMRSSPNIYDRTKILDFYHANGRNQTRTATYFKANGFPNISQTTVSRMVVRERPVRYVDDEDA